MENNYTDDFYETLEEINAQIEDVINECNKSEALDLVIPILHQKAQEFIEDFQREIEKLDLIEVEI